MTAGKILEQMCEAGIRLCSIILVAVALAAFVMMLTLLIALIGVPMIALVDVLGAWVDYWAQGWKP